ncbi:SRPBCC domain-containing protein [Candidatus Deferrimicrobium sp.]|uniref:SRPBCC domain-containing protein n=1 Tax=Candidatus Deferrimicrobium sp. TaxID=3060586 RepID=UPI003C3CEE9D
MSSTIRLHRVLRAAPERVYRAFLEPEAMVKWFPPNGFTGKVHHMDARVGGSYRMSFTTQEGVPDTIPAEACYLGWQESLALLVKLVEAEIQDEP